MKLLKLEDIIKEDNIKFEQIDQYNYLLNQEPPREWLKTNKRANNSQYLPIGRVEFLLTKIFKYYKVEVLQTSQVLNGVMCTVRIHYVHPVTGEWLYHDGTGAAEIQTKSGASPIDFHKINPGALSRCVPTAYSNAIKNTAKRFGKLFGRDLNRLETGDYRNDLIEMGTTHPNWNKLVTAVKDGAYTIEEITASYDLDDDALDVLLSINQKTEE